MNIKQQCVSLELSKKLKALNIKQKSFFHWYVSQRSNYSFILESKTCNYVVDSQDEYDIYSAYTASELLEMLPNYAYEIIKSIRFIEFGCEQYRISFKEDNLCNALAKILIYLIENRISGIKNDL